MNIQKKSKETIVSEHMIPTLYRYIDTANFSVPKDKIDRYISTQCGFDVSVNNVTFENARLKGNFEFLNDSGEVTCIQFDLHRP